MSQQLDRPSFKRMKTEDLLASAVGIWTWDVACNRLRADARFAELYRWIDCKQPRVWHRTPSLSPFTPQTKCVFALPSPA